MCNILADGNLCNGVDMMLRRHWCAVLLVAATLLAGCISRDEVYEDIYRNRKLAYEQWKLAKEGKEGGQVVLHGELDVASSVLLAMGNNKQLIATLADKEKARGRITEAYSEALPKLDLTGSYTRLNIPTAGTTARNNYAVTFVLTQPIFRGGAISAGIRGAKLFAYITDEDVAATVQDVVYKARQGYYDVLLARELVKVSEGDLGLSKAHLEDVQKKKAAGVVSEYDVLRARVEVSNVEAQLIERQNSLHLALTSLLKTLGVSQESQVTLTDKLEHMPIAYSLDQAVETAFRERPEILRAELSVRLNSEGVVQARSGFFPRIDASVTETNERPHPRIAARDHWDQAWSAGVSMTWPVFDGLATWGRVQQAKAALKRSVIELADAEEQALLDVKQALFSLEDADKFVKSQADNLERAREGLRLAKAGYDAGVNTELEMLDARQALSQTQALYYQAVYRHETAKLSLERATGILKNQQPGAPAAEMPEVEAPGGEMPAAEQ